MQFTITDLGFTILDFVATTALSIASSVQGLVKAIGIAVDILLGGYIIAVSMMIISRLVVSKSNECLYCSSLLKDRNV